MANLLNVRTINYLEFVGNGKLYRVPPYQRDYSWSEEQWEDLWIDVCELLPDRKRQHYLGALIVENQNDREFSIIDGQQRLATLSLLALAVIRRLSVLADSDIDPNENTERARELRGRFVGEKDPTSLFESSRLHLNHIDNEFYQDNLIRLRPPRSSRGLPKSNHLLLKCYQYFCRKIEESDELRNDGMATASLLSEAAARQLSFILITVDDELNAYAVFETLNAREIGLTTTDLLKNYLFSLVKSGPDLEYIQRRWRALVGTVGATRFPDFLRYHLLCSEPKIRKQRLFKLVRDRTKSADDALVLLDALNARGELFTAFLDPNRDYWLDLHPDARSCIRDLCLFGVRQQIPLLFAARESFAENDFVRVLKLISTISFRYTIVSRLNANALEHAYHRAAKAITDGRISTPAEVFDLVRSIYVPDDKMGQDFALLEIDTKRRRKLAKYILAKLEEDAAGRACDPSTDPGTIEHILPENPAEVWRETYPSEHWESGINRLGNLTLLEASANRDIGSGSYPEKLIAYGGSGYALTRQLPDMAPEHWSPELVRERQRGLAERAKLIWRSDFA